MVTEIKFVLVSSRKIVNHVSMTNDVLTKNWFERIVIRFPKKVAVLDHSKFPFQEKITYQELNSFVYSFEQSFLENWNISYDFKIGIISENLIEHIILFLLCLKNGWVLVPLNYKLKKEELRYQIEKAKIDFLFYTNSYWGNPKEEFKDLFSQERIIDILEFRNTWKNYLIEFNKKREFKIDPERELLYLFTSGSTSDPKTVKISRRMVFWNNFQTCLFWGLNYNDTGLVHTPFNHAGGISVLTTPLLSIGGTLVLHSAFDVNKVVQLLKEKMINLLFAVPTMFASLSKHPEFDLLDLSYLKLIISGGAPCPESLIDIFFKKGVIFKQGFGMTEAGVNCFFIPNEEAKLHPNSVGFPMPYCDMSLINEKGEEIEGAGEGELFIQGPVLFSGYLGENSEFNPQFGFGTGDIFRRDKKGLYYVVGRKKDIIIRGGENINPLEIESIILNSDAVSECVVVGKNDSYWGEVPVAVISLKNKNASIPEILIKNLSEKLTSFKRPKEIYVILELPKLSSGKIDKKQIKDLINKQKLQITLDLSQK